MKEGPSGSAIKIILVGFAVERVLANVDADEGDRMLGCVCHGVLLVFGAPHKHRLLVGREHGRTIPLTDIDRQFDLLSHRVETRYCLVAPRRKREAQFGDGGPDFFIPVTG